MLRTLFLAAVSLALAPGPPARAVEETVVTIDTALGDTTETFWLQIPDGYRPEAPCPLLIGWHQLGGNELEMKNSSDFDSIANARGWIAASHLGSSRTNWANHATQSHVTDVIRWIEGRYDVDPARIYMVGASMGGAAGMVYADNHLDPDGPMIAAAASISGIQDCERRYHEQGINQSMIAAFGGTPEEVPFTYHRNSSICFADSTESMHMNARHLPLYLTFGYGVSDEPWRSHAEDLYAAMAGIADTVVLRESPIHGHGWMCAEDGEICDFLERFSCDPYPSRISIDADEPGAWYWADVTMRIPGAYARFEGEVDPGVGTVAFTMLRNVDRAILALAPLGFPLDGERFACDWDVREGGTARIGFRGLSHAPSAVARDGVIYDRWSYDEGEGVLSIAGEGAARYTILREPAAAPETGSVNPRLTCWIAGSDRVRYRAPGAGGIRFDLYDATGRSLHRGVASQAEGEIPILRNLPSGIYFFEMRGDDRRRLVRKLVVTR
jgi:pimeloyl-ACP methyl ester carboxylesterase